jgi:osmotically inducible protein OsmC
MALAFQLQTAGFTPKSSTDANLTMTQQGGGFRDHRHPLDLTARVPGIAAAQFERLADEAKANCPVSKVLNAEISLNATLEGAAQPA